MTTAEHTKPSLLGSLAQHEAQLQSQLESAGQEAREIVERARSEARKHIHEVETSTIEEIGRIRRDAEAKRQAAFDSTVGEAEARLVSVREEALRRTPDVVQAVLGLFIPGETS